MEKNPGPGVSKPVEDYKLLPCWRDWALSKLRCPVPALDGFAEPHNTQYPVFWTPHTNAFTKDWRLERPVWMNPPFSLMAEVLRRIQTEGAHIVLVCPSYSPELNSLKILSSRHTCLPRVPLYLRHGATLMPTPKWSTWVLYFNREPLHLRPDQVKGPQRLITEFLRRPQSDGKLAARGVLGPAPKKTYVTPSTETRKNGVHGRAAEESLP